MGSRNHTYRCKSLGDIATVIHNEEILGKAYLNFSDKVIGLAENVNDFETPRVHI